MNPSLMEVHCMGRYWQVHTLHVPIYVFPNILLLSFNFCIINDFVKQIFEGCCRKLFLDRSYHNLKSTMPMCYPSSFHPNHVK